MKKILPLVLVLFFQLSFAQKTVIKNVIDETIELISKKSTKLLQIKSSENLILSYARILTKNGFGKKIRVSNSSVKMILKDISELRGKSDLIKVGQKLSLLNSNNLNSIKGFLAEELHHNELIRLKNISNIEIGKTFETSKYVRKKQLNFIKSRIKKNKYLYVHKKVEIDIMASKNGSKFIIEVKNIDSHFTKQKFEKYLSQMIKQKAFATENGIEKIFWSNIGTSILSPIQVNEMEKIGVIVLQKGSTSPIINAKINMNKIKRILSKM